MLSISYLSCCDTDSGIISNPHARRVHYAANSFIFLGSGTHCREVIESRSCALVHILLQRGESAMCILSVVLVTDEMPESTVVGEK